MSSADSEELTWYVKGSIRYVTEDGSQQEEGAIYRNIVARDQRAAADQALEWFQSEWACRGQQVSDLAWVSDPEVSPFDPFMDR